MRHASSGPTARSRRDFHCFSALFHASLLVCVLTSPAALRAEVATDGTLGPRATLPGPDVQIGADLGQIRGTNLFHSFERFDVETGGSATFTGPSGLENVIGRVTGGARSSIDGTLRSTIPGADLYLLNPAGIVFGPNARLDVRGAFHASTAGELRFSDGAAFSALDPSGSMLSVAEPQAFGFLGGPAGGITVDRGVLEVPRGEALSLVGGDVAVAGPEARVAAEAGRVAVAGAGPAASVAVASGEIQGDASARVRVSDRALLTSSGDGGGLVLIRAGQLVVEGRSSVFADNTGASAPTGGLAIDAETVTVTSGSAVTTDVFGLGAGGRLLVAAETLKVRDDAIVGARTFDEGDAGSVTINATMLVEVANGGEISSSTNGGGDAGGVTVDASLLTVDGEGNPSKTGISSQANRVSSGGDAGAVTINATGLVEVLAGGQIGSSTFATGNASGVTVNAGDLVVDGGLLPLVTAIASNADRNSTGAGGTVTIKAKGLVELRSGGQITSGTFGEKDAGAINVEAGRVVIDSNGSAGATGIASQAEEGSIGDAGTVRVVAGAIEVLDGGGISSSALDLSTGDAGGVRVEAARLVVDGDGSPFATSIASQADSESRGAAGTVTIVSSEMVEIRDGGTISSSTFAGGDAGGVTLQAVELIVDAQGSAAFTAITSDANDGSTGNAGAVNVTADNISVRNGGTISSNARGEGAGGAVTINATDLVELRNGGDISSSTFAQGDAGAVTVQAGRLIVDDQGNAERFTGIASQANDTSSGAAGTVEVAVDAAEVRGGGAISSSSFAEGRAGDVEVRAANLTVRDGGLISSSGLGIGSAGNIRLEVDTLLTEDASIRTQGTGAEGGAIDVAAADRIYLQDAEVTSSGIEPVAGASLITLAAPEIVLNASTVTSLTGAGAPLAGSGEARLLGDLTVISADSLVAGSSTVQIEGQLTNLGSGLQLSLGAFLDVGRLLRESCAAAAAGAAPSSFIRAGRGGLPPTPDRPLASVGTAAREEATPVPETAGPAAAAEGTTVAAAAGPVFLEACGGAQRS